VKKRLIVLALAFCLVLTVFSPSIALADSEITVIDSGASVDFPMRLTFDLTARSDVNITDIRLRYSFDHTTFATVTNEAYIDFTPAKEVDISWSLEMVKIGGLPTGSALDYWWQITDASGATIETSPSRIQFDDNRYDWNVYTEGELTLYCYQEDDDFVADLMAAAQEALTRLAEDTGAELTRPARFYIYENALDLQGAMIYPQEWTGGVAYPRLGIIAIGISPTNLDWGKRAMAHELAHLVVHEMILNPYSGIPRWLDEGLAMYAEGPMESTFADALSDAIYRGQLLSVPSLASPFSAYSGNAALSYAQSYSLVEYLIITYGQPKMLELLHTFGQGIGYDDALEAVYGFDMTTLDDLWREYAASPYVPPAVDETDTEIDPLAVVLMAVVGVGLVVTIIILIRMRLRRRV
jgi:hypothetical protein